MASSASSATASASASASAYALQPNKSKKQNASGSSRQSRDQVPQLCPNNWKISGCAAGSCRKKHDDCLNGNDCPRIFFHKSKVGKSNSYVLCLHKHPTSTHKWMLDNEILKPGDSVDLMNVKQVTTIIVTAKRYQEEVILDRVGKMKVAGLYANEKALEAQNEITDERIKAITIVKKAVITKEKKASLFHEYRKALIGLLEDCDYDVNHPDYEKFAEMYKEDYLQDKKYDFTPEEIEKLKEGYQDDGFSCRSLQVGESSE